MALGRHVSARPSPLLLAFASIALAAALVSRVHAQEAGSPVQSGITIEEVVVTGSNIPTAENVTPNPVDTYRRTDLIDLGIRSPTDFVQKLPEAMGGAFNENNVNGGDGRTELNLRGILPKETLVLQDGRRVAPVGFAGDTVDLNTIPIGLIDHVDLLKDGASAIYGADAVAGVLNIYLIHRFRGLELYTSYGNSNLGQANDQFEERSYLLAGRGDDKTNLVVYAEYYSRGAIYARDIDISHNADFTSFGGVDTRSGNFAGRVGRFVYQPQLNGGMRTPSPHSFLNVQSDPQYVPLSSLPPSSRAFNFNDLTSAMGASDRQYLYGAFETNVCQKFLSVFADFKYARTFWDVDLAPAPFAPDVFADAIHPGGISPAGISVPTQNPFNPFILPDYTSAGGFDPRVPGSAQSAVDPGTQFITGVRYRALEGGPRTDKITTENYVFTGGLKGDLGQLGQYFGNWLWEAAFRYSEDARLERSSGLVNKTNLRAALLDTNPATAFNPFGLNQNSPAALSRIFSTTNHFGATSLILEDLKLSGDLFNAPAGPVSFAAGAEHRRERARDTPDALTASDETYGGVNFGPIRGGRDVFSTYCELLVPITSASWNAPGLHSVELGFQERYENFSDFGASERPKFLLRWQPIDTGLTIRGTYSEAFHAPTVGDLFRAPQESFTFVRDPHNHNASVEALAQTSGNADLQPETAYQWTYGAVATPGVWWSPLEGLTATADFYHIDIRAVTTQLDPQFLIDHEAQFPGQIIRGSAATPANPFDPIVLLLLPEQNLGRMIEEGWDYSASYSFDTKRLGRGDWGTVTATMRGTYVSRAVVQAVVGGPEEIVVGKFGAGFLGTTAGGALTHNRWSASLFYSGPGELGLNGLDTGLTAHCIGQFWDNRTFTSDGNDRKVREWTTIDWVLNYTFAVPVSSSSGYKVAGVEKNGGKASPSSSKWRDWLNNTTVTVGINNVTDEQPPFVAAAVENGYDETTANVKGRTWYVAFKKRF